MLKPIRLWLLHFARVAMLAAILWLIHLQHGHWLTTQQAQSLADVAISEVQSIFPEASRIGSAERHGGRSVLSESRYTLGYVIQTTPESDPYVGFSGPSNLMVGFDMQNQIVGVRILQSGDTREHVELVRKESSFLKKWIGLTWSQAAERSTIDAVSGATLTSYAMIQGLQNRLGADEVSQKFPAILEVTDATSLYPEADRVEQDRSMRALWHVYDPEEKPLGAILRTSPAADQIIGYQGPTETLLAIDDQGRITEAAMGKTFDTEPYVGRVKRDKSFQKVLKKYSIDEWSQLNLEVSRIEGVSGATMTSQAMASGIAETAKRYLSELNRQKKKRENRMAGLRRDIGTIAMILVGAIVGLTSLRGNSRIRIVFQILVVVYLGFMQGDLLSMAMVRGWSESGIPWSNGLSLVALSIAAVVVPIAARSNLYCSHLCPHGTVQQWLPRRWKHKKPLPVWLVRSLHAIRPLLILWIIAVCLFQWRFSLVDIEPFDAYAWRAAAWPTVAIAIIGVVLSLKIPMAYCRFGCATGSVLQYLRRNSKSDRLNRVDLFVMACLVLGWAIYWANHPFN